MKNDSRQTIKKKTMVREMKVHFRLDNPLAWQVDQLAEHYAVTKQRVIELAVDRLHEAEFGNSPIKPSNKERIQP